MEHKEIARLITSSRLDAEKFYLETFDKISDEKKARIIKAALTEFSRNGFNAANINLIAKNAGISIGSLYNYFASKEDLYLTLIDYGYNLLQSVINQPNDSSGDIFDNIERLLRAAQAFAKNYPEITQIYLDMSTEGLAGISGKLFRKMETVSSGYYRSLIIEAKKQGIVSSEVDENFASFCIDNIIMMVQFSYTLRFYKERMKIFTGVESPSGDESIIQGAMTFIRRALAP